MAKGHSLFVPKELRADSPRYRFRGSQPPQPGARTPLRAEATAAVDETGVATIQLYDPIDSWGGEWGVSAKEFTAVLAEMPTASEIRLHINSPGGEVYEAIAILNALRAHPANVVAIVDGLAASAASFIATGADELVMGRNTQLMVHDAWGVCVGPSADMRDLADRLDQISNNIASIYAAKAGGSIESWREVMLAETWMDADEAVASGLADRIDEPLADEPKNSFDLTVFKHQGRADAPPPLIPTPTAASERTDVMAARHRLNAARFGLPV